jgi:hypothetical protein
MLYHPARREHPHKVRPDTPGAVVPVRAEGARSSAFGDGRSGLESRAWGSARPRSKIPDPISSPFVANPSGSSRPSVSHLPCDRPSFASFPSVQIHGLPVRPPVFAHLRAFSWPTLPNPPCPHFGLSVPSVSSPLPDLPSFPSLSSVKPCFKVWVAAPRPARSRAAAPRHPLHDRTNRLKLVITPRDGSVDQLVGEWFFVLSDIK